MSAEPFEPEDILPHLAASGQQPCGCLPRPGATRWVVWTTMPTSPLTLTWTAWCQLRHVMCNTTSNCHHQKVMMVSCKKTGIYRRHRTTAEGTPRHVWETPQLRNKNKMFQLQIFFMHRLSVSGRDMLPRPLCQILVNLVADTCIGQLSKLSTLAIVHLEVYGMSCLGYSRCRLRTNHELADEFFGPCRCCHHLQSLMWTALAQRFDFVQTTTYIVQTTTGIMFVVVCASGVHINDLRWWQHRQGRKTVEYYDRALFSS